jgi:hypothetical protein
MQMKSMVKNFILVLVVLSFSADAFAETIGIDPGSYKFYRTYPINIFDNYARCQMLYLRSEIMFEGEISKIRFFQSNGTSATINNCRIHMCEVGYSTLSEWMEGDDNPGTKVFDGDLVTSTTAGWFEIELDTPFYYSNDVTKNLLISFRHQDGEWENFPKWRVSTATYRCVEGGDDNVNPPSVSGCFLPDIQIDIGEPPVSRPHAPEEGGITFWNECGGSDEAPIYSFNAENPTPGYIMAWVNHDDDELTTTLTHCRVQFSSDDKFDPAQIMYDTGKKEFPVPLYPGEQWPADLVRYFGEAIESDQLIHTHVRVWDDLGAQSPWSESKAIDFDSFDESYFNETSNIEWTTPTCYYDEEGIPYYYLMPCETLDFTIFIQGFIPVDTTEGDITLVSLIDFHSDTDGLTGELSYKSHSLEITAIYDYPGGADGMIYVSESITASYHCNEVGLDRMTSSLWVKSKYEPVTIPNPNEVVVAWTYSGNDPFIPIDPPSTYDVLEQDLLFTQIDIEEARCTNYVDFIDLQIDSDIWDEEFTEMGEPDEDSPGQIIWPGQRVELWCVMKTAVSGKYYWLKILTPECIKIYDSPEGGTEIVFTEENGELVYKFDQEGAVPFPGNPDWKVKKFWAEGICSGSTYIEYGLLRGGGIFEWMLVDPFDHVKVSIIGIERLRLGYYDSISEAKSVIGAIYIPTKWEGYFHLTFPEGIKGKVFYLYEGGWIGAAPICISSILSDPLTEDVYNNTIYDIPENEHGWYYIRCTGEGTVEVANVFYQEHELSKTPWNSWWWPMNDGVNPNMFDITVNYGDTHGPEPGPLKKYDDYKNIEAPNPDSSWGYEYVHWKEPAAPPGTYEYLGMCDAMAWAGFEEVMPNGDKTLEDPDGNEIVFRKQDRIGLCAERYWVPTGEAAEENVDEPGLVFNLFRKTGDALYADWFHTKLRTRIADDVGGVIVYSEYFSCGIYKYCSIFMADGTSDIDCRKITIDTQLTYKGTAQWEGSDEAKSTTYKLQYANDGTIPTDGTGELQWTENKPSKCFYKKRTAPLVNPMLDKAVLELIFR